MPTHPDATGMEPMLIYHASEPVLPEVEAKPTIASQLKEAMVAEGALITGNVKIFLGTMGIAAIGVTDIAIGNGSWQENTILGVLIGTVVFLFRLIIVERKENKEEVRKLWERLLREKNEESDEDEEQQVNARPQRHRKK